MTRHHHASALSRSALSGAVAASALAAAAAQSAPAAAQDFPEIEANVALVSDYRFRGVSLSDEAFAIQGGFDANFDSGLYAGVWASSIDEFENSEIETDFYLGYGWEAGGLSFDVGGIAYVYPGSEDTHYYEVYGSVGFVSGIVESEVGAAYAPDQDNLGDDNGYVYYAASVPLGESGLSAFGEVGYETGAFGDLDGDGDDKINWSLGLGWTAAGLDFSAAYVDTSEDTDGSDATAILTIAKAF